LLGAALPRMVDGAMGPFTVADSPLLRPLAEIISKNPTLLLAHLFWLVAVAVIVRLAWLLLLAGVLGQLASPVGAATLLARGVRGLPRILVVGLWHALLRLLLVAGPGWLAFEVLEGGWAAFAWGVVALSWWGSVVALDLAWTRAVLRPRRPYHPRTAWRGYVEAVRRPGVLLASSGLVMLQSALLLAVPYLAATGAAEGAGPWIPRLLAALACVVALLRLAVAVEAVESPAGRRFAS
ncbi:MAG: hypothetical protein MI919_15875, partial [Holophagales bacterium]|nr:hypothetical protein [Holophagales bacterium]